MIFLLPVKYKGVYYIIRTSIEDMPRILKYKWHLNYENKSMYAYANVPGKRGKKVSLHRLILDAPKDKLVDHINHNTLDNTRGNLRVVTSRENQLNRKGAAKHNRTGVRNVTLTNDGRYMVRYDGKYFGVYTMLAEAEIAAKKARGELYEP